MCITLLYIDHVACDLPPAKRWLPINFQRSCVLTPAPPSCPLGPPSCTGAEERACAAGRATCSGRWETGGGGGLETAELWAESPGGWVGRGVLAASGTRWPLSGCTPLELSHLLNIVLVNFRKGRPSLSIDLSSTTYF